MESIYSPLCKLFLVLGLASFVVGIIAKASGFVLWGLFPLSYLRFTGICLLFIMAMSLYHLAVKK